MDPSIPSAKRLEMFMAAYERYYRAALNNDPLGPDEPDPKAFGLTTEQDLWCVRKMVQQLTTKNN